ncbi:MAG: hypothetical protein QXO35_03475 [Candidatus Micrarchaeia archaeon]
MTGEIITIRKSFTATINEIKEMEKQKKEILPKHVEEEEEAVEIFTMDYGEAMSELRRLYLIKRLTKK